MSLLSLFFFCYLPSSLGCLVTESFSEFGAESSKDERPQEPTATHRKEEPHVEGHRHQHQQQPRPHLEKHKSRTRQIHPPTKGNPLELPPRLAMAQHVVVLHVLLYVTRRRSRPPLCVPPLLTYTAHRLQRLIENA